MEAAYKNRNDRAARLGCSGTVWAGLVPDVNGLPDDGSSFLLLGMGVTAVGFVRRAFWR